MNVRQFPLTFLNVIVNIFSAPWSTVAIVPHADLSLQIRSIQAGIRQPAVPTTYFKQETLS